MEDRNFMDIVREVQRTGQASPSKTQSGGFFEIVKAVQETGQVPEWAKDLPPNEVPAP